MFLVPPSAISRHRRPIKLSPQHQPPATYPIQRLSGHNFGAEVQSNNCIQKTGFLADVLRIDEFSEREHVVTRPTAINQFKRPHRNPPLDQTERSHDYNPRLGPLIWQDSTQHLLILRVERQIWPRFSDRTRHLSTQLANSAQTTSSQSTHTPRRARERIIPWAWPLIL